MRGEEVNIYLGVCRSEYRCSDMVKGVKKKEIISGIRRWKKQLEVKCQLVARWVAVDLKWPRKM